MNNTILLVIVALLTASGVFAAESRPTLDVWPGTAPGEKGDIGTEHVSDASGNIQRLANVSKPTITVYKPDRAKDTGAAILICPGGAYTILAMDLEGEEVAMWANSIGVTGIVLKYRVPARKGQPRYLAPLQDAQRAMRLARANAKQWQIDPKRIGILGFSAGGHLAATTSNNFGKSSYETIDDTDKLDCRPDFTVLVYPAYLTEGNGLVAELPVTEKTPPAFMAHASDDGISSENSVAYYLALKKNKIAAELHIFARGGHGFGLRPSDNPCCAWPDRCAQWLKSMGFLEARP
jgi:acetyl esterase/lipase